MSIYCTADLLKKRRQKISSGRTSKVFNVSYSSFMQSTSMLGLIVTLCFLIVCFIKRVYFLMLVSWLIFDTHTRGLRVFSQQFLIFPQCWCRATKFKWHFSSSKAKADFSCHLWRGRGIESKFIFFNLVQLFSKFPVVQRGYSSGAS